MTTTKRIRGNNIPDKFDTYVYGSDQIWNPRLTNGFDPVFFARWGSQDAHKRHISYAASMEATDITCEQRNELQNLLRNFNAISVRETILSKLLTGMTSTDIQIVLDPTLLIDPMIWSSLAKEPKYKQKYVLIYQVVSCPDIYRIASIIARERNAFPGRDRYRQKCSKVCAGLCQEVS